MAEEVVNAEASISAGKDRVAFIKDIMNDIPSFSLGLTPCERISFGQINSHHDNLKEISSDKTTNDSFPERPRREKRLPYTKRSPYVKRVQKIKIHACPEEDAVWDW